ncbi:hypothetical protein F4778DRAFT_800593 [Xylariomycetidae sp. FL2044]|nr:hypothetical protein F4778DRAFT_800593 [Xylariomycetidae sp. FL2044]
MVARKTRSSARPDSQAKEKLGLNWTPAEREAYLDKIKVVDLPRLDEPYPIDNLYTAGTETAKKQWADCMSSSHYWHGRPLRDPRYVNASTAPESTTTGCAAIFSSWTDESRLQYRILQDESVIFRDADTKEVVLVVLRDFVPDEALRLTMVDLCKEIIKNRRDDRREDPGQLVHFGYTCGSRHEPCIQLAASCLRLNTAAKVRNEKQLNIKAQGMAGIVWNLMKSRLPAEIIADYNDTILENDFPRMDMGREVNSFEFSVRGKKVVFDDLELPPPSALSAINYARHTHRESNGNNWILALTANAPADATKGGNFYLASYGIMLCPATNTVTAWHPTDYHGTTLYEMQEGPEKRMGYEIRTDGGFNTGVVFEISKALKNARKNSAWLDNRPKAKVAKIAQRKAKASKQTRYSLRSRVAPLVD